MAKANEVIVTVITIVLGAIAAIVKLFSKDEATDVQPKSKEED